MKRNILKDTILLTVMQMILDGLGLLLNAFMTRRIGSEAMGIFTLTGSFFRLASLIAGGNVFLCASRFISEELGKEIRNPKRVLADCFGVSLVLSFCISGLIWIFSTWCSIYFFKSPELAMPVRFMACTLPLVTVTACFKGYFNACCQTAICAIADAVDFFLHTFLTGLAVYILPLSAPADLCNLTAWCTIGSESITLIFLLCSLPRCHAEATGKASVTLRQYIRLAVPVMGGSALTALLSATNDALVPFTLKQSGNSSAEAFSQFGIFEAIVIPVLFFPSTVLVSLSGILVTETAREHAGNNQNRITDLTRKAIQKTIVFSVFVTEILILFGKEIGVLLGGGETAGKTIALIAPVVPFIYLEIVLESIIRGIGSQAFSSLNYFAEYIVRISCVLIFIPMLGFYGIVLSYYTSNIFGNVSRILHVIRKTGMKFSFPKMLGIPLFSAVFSAQAGMLVFHSLHLVPEQNAFCISGFILLCCPVYVLLQKTFCRFPEKNPVCKKS